MDKEIAEKVLDTAVGCAVELSGIVPLLKSHCDDVEYEKYGKKVAKAVAIIIEEIEDPIFAMYPELEEVIEKKKEAFFFSGKSHN